MERLKSHRDFVTVLKRRRTITDKDIVLHVLVHDDASLEHANEPSHQDRMTQPHRRVGLAVSKSVGNAVTRNRVKRRFRVLASRFESTLPLHCDVILRAKPGAARAPFSSLEPQVAAVFSRVQGCDHPARRRLRKEEQR